MLYSSPRNMNDSAEFWSLYQTAERRIGPLSSTPKTPRSMRVPETPNVTNIDENRNTQLDESIDLQNVNTMLITFMKKCESLKAENASLKETVAKQQINIRELTSLVKRLNSSSEMESSESHNERSASLTLSNNSKSTKVQRVTPTKRQTSSSSSSNSSTPVVRPTTSTPRTDRTQSSSSMNTARRPSNETLILPRRQRISIQNRTPQSLPNINRTRNVNFRNANTPTTTLPPITIPLSEQRQPTRRRLFDEPISVNEIHRSRSEPAIEHLQVSEMKDAAWGRPCPPRIHLEQNRPDFILRLQARQRIIKAAAERRAEIEQRKRIAARAVATGQRSVESVSSELFADSTAVRAFRDYDMRKVTLRTVRKSEDYKNRVAQRLSNIEKATNKIIVQTHNVRTRSTSRPRRNQF